MATRNVQTDYGAAGDGSTDDTVAIQDAIRDAQPGDTVYLPAGTYVVNKANSPDNEAVVQFSSEFGVNDVTFEGDGESTVIKLDAGHDAFTQVVQITPYSTISGLTIRNLVIDGNRSNQNTSEGGHGMAIPSEGAHDNDILVQNVRIQDNVGSGLSSRSGGVTIEHVSVINSAEHGISPNHPVDGNPVIIRRCYVEGAAAHSKLDYAFDFSGGTGVIEESVGVDSAGSGIKVTGQSENVRIRRTRIRGANKIGFHKTDPGSVTATLEDVVISGGDALGMRPADDMTVHVPSGAELVSVGHVEDGLRPVDNARIEVDGTFHAANNGNEGLSGGDGTSGYVSDFQSANNGGGNDPGPIDVRSRGSDPKTDIDGVPTADEVGAFRGATEPVEDPEETFQTDFGDATVGAQPDGWAREWATGDGDFTVGSGGDLGGKRLELTASAGARRALRWTAPGSVADVELHARLTLPEFDADTNDYCRLYARGGGGDGTETAYFFSVRDGAFAIRKYDGGSMTELWSGGTPAAGQPYLVRFRAEGTDLKLKVWEADAGEPDDWTATASDSGISTAGWAGVGAYSDAAQYWDGVTAGTGGLEAPALAAAESDASGGTAIATTSALIQSSNGTVDTL